MIPFKPVTDRVAAGVAWLDEHAPDWVAAINVDRLDLNDCTACILGQIYGSYWKAPVSDPEWTKTDLKIALGFAARTRQEDQRAEYAELDTAWRLVIEGRRVVVTV